MSACDPKRKSRSLKVVLDRDEISNHPAHTKSEQAVIDQPFGGEEILDGTDCAKLSYGFVLQN